MYILHGIVLPQIRRVDVGGRSSVDLQGVVPADFEFGGVPGRGFPCKFKHSGDIEGSFHLSTLEVEGGHHAGGDVTSTTV